MPEKRNRPPRGQRFADRGRRLDICTLQLQARLSHQVVRLIYILKSWLRPRCCRTQIIRIQFQADETGLAQAEGSRPLEMYLAGFQADKGHRLSQLWDCERQGLTLTPRR
jgi:hypothetical protein